VTGLNVEGGLPVNIGTIPASIHAKDFIKVFSGEYLWHDLSLVAEYLHGDMETTVFGGKTVVMSVAYYLMGSYRFTKKLEAGAYYSESYPDADDKSGERYKAVGLPDYLAWQKDISLFVRYDINDHFTFKIEGHYVDGASDVLMPDNPTRNSKNWWYYVVRGTFNF